MNDRFKFRIWSQTQKEYEDIDDKYIALNISTGEIAFSDFCENYCKPEWADDFIIEQCTGLYDSTKWEQLSESEQKEWLKTHKEEDWKGKLIYEGDICEFARPGYNPEISEAIFNQRKCSFEFKEAFNGRTSMAGKQIEIIGNIHTDKGK